MSRKYWFGVGSADNLRSASPETTWWCLPYSAEEGDVLLLYYPRSVSAAKQGVFAETVVLVSPVQLRKENYYCSGYGLAVHMVLGYAEIEVIQRFTPTLTAKQIKSDPLLRHTDLVRRNFQGTTFAIDEMIYRRMKELLGK